MEKPNKQSGLSIVEAITAAAILALSVVVFMTLQSNQEKNFSLLRKFDKAAFAVNLIFEELSAIYNQRPNQYGEPVVHQNVTPSNQLPVRGLTSLPSVGDQFVIAGVPGNYEITARTNFNPQNISTLTVVRVDIPNTSPNLNIATNAVSDAAITFILNSTASLNPYNSIDLTKYNNVAYQNIFSGDVRDNLIKWGGLLNKHLGKSFDGDKRLLEVSDVTVTIPVDENNDGITDQNAGVDLFTSTQKTQVIFRLKQGSVEEVFTGHFTRGF
jgi:hypothetical protein